MTREKVSELINGNWIYQVSEGNTLPYTFSNGIQSRNGKTSSYSLIQKDDNVLFIGEDTIRVDHISKTTMIWDKNGLYHLFVRV